MFLAILVQNDGNILISGYFTFYNGYPRNSIARIDSSGTLDDSFQPMDGTDNYISLMSIQSDGKIIIAGSFSVYNGNPCNNIARIGSDGSFDDSFNAGTGSDSNIISMAIQSDGKIVIGGQFLSFNGVLRSHMARLNTDGSIDASYLGQFDYAVRAILMD